MSEGRAHEADETTGPAEADARGAASAGGGSAAVHDDMHDVHGMAGEGGHGDDHHDAHMDASLGSIDWPLWGAAVLGVAIAVFMAVLMALVVGMI
ncbi:MAG TPA: hypothetical protein VIF44_00440 [Candidatus Limnocylindrales bacterium]|jgi:hypothetical protein